MCALLWGISERREWHNEVYCWRVGKNGQGANFLCSKPGQTHAPKSHPANNADRKPINSGANGEKYSTFELRNQLRVLQPRAGLLWCRSRKEAETRGAMRTRSRRKRQGVVQLNSSELNPCQLGKGGTGGAMRQMLCSRVKGRPLQIHEHVRGERTSLRRDRPSLPERPGMGFATHLSQPQPHARRSLVPGVSV